MMAMDSDLRRRGMKGPLKEPNFRATFMAHLFCEWLLERLSKAMVRR